MNIQWSRGASAVIEHALESSNSRRRWVLHEQLDYIRDGLTHTPDREGESRSENVRIWFTGVFQLLYEIQPDRSVKVLKVRIDDRHWRFYDDPNNLPI